MQLSVRQKIILIINESRHLNTQSSISCNFFLREIMFTAMDVAIILRNPSIGKNMMNVKVLFVVIKEILRTLAIQKLFCRRNYAVFSNQVEFTECYSLIIMEEELYLFTKFTSQLLSSSICGISTFRLMCLWPSSIQVTYNRFQT